MKLNTENYDQASFPHKRVVLSLLWLRMQRFTPDALRVSYKDMLQIAVEHYCPQLIDYARSVLGKFKRIINKVRGA